MKETDFESIDEMSDWYHRTCDECMNEKYPDKPNANFKLQKRYFVQDKGVDASKSTELCERLERTSGDAGAALGCLGLGDAPKKGKSVSDQHRLAYTKLQQSISKLGRSLGICEQTMPAQKRQMTPMAFQKYKQGFHSCRDCRDQALDEAEDLKDPEEGEMLDCMDKITKLQAKVSEHLDCLLEAMQNHAPKKMKKEDKKDEKKPAQSSQGPHHKQKSNQHPDKQTTTLGDMKISLAWAKHLL